MLKGVSLAVVVLFILSVSVTMFPHKAQALYVSGSNTCPSAVSAPIINTSSLANGQISTSVTSGCNSYEFAGPAGSAISYDATSAALNIPDDKSQVVTVNSSTIYQNAEAVGFSPTQAAQMIAGLPNTSAGSAQIIGSPCVKISANGGQATGRTCDLITLLQKNGGNWYIGDQLTTSGHDGTWWDNLTRMYGNDNYAKGNSIVQWNPSGYESTGDCHQETESVGYDGTGVSDTQTVCPSGIGPQWSDPTTGYGSVWNGCSGNTQGLPGVDVLHSPANVSDAMVVRIGLSWALC